MRRGTWINRKHQRTWRRSCPIKDINPLKERSIRGCEATLRSRLTISRRSACSPQWYCLHLPLQKENREKSESTVWAVLKTMHTPRPSFICIVHNSQSSYLPFDDGRRDIQRSYLFSNGASLINCHFFVTFVIQFVLFTNPLWHVRHGGWF